MDVFSEPFRIVDLGVYLDQANYPPWGFTSKVIGHRRGAAAMANFVNVRGVDPARPSRVFPHLRGVLAVPVHHRDGCRWGVLGGVLAIAEFMPSRRRGAAAATATMNFWSVGGFTVAGLIDRLGRTAVTRLSYGTASVSVLLLAVAALAKSPGATLAAFTLCVFSATCSWISAYTTFSELFPTELRATGIGVSVAAGRLGGMVGVVGLSYAVAGLGLVSAFVILAVFFGIGAIAALRWGRRGGIEARGLSLDAVAPVGVT